MRQSNRTSKFNKAIVAMLTLAMTASMTTITMAASSINNNTKKPTVVDSGTWIDSGFEISDDWEGIISIDVETDKYNNKETKDLVDKVNGGEDIEVTDFIKELPTTKGKTNAESYPTTDGYDVNLKLYDRITDFYDIRYHKDGHNSNVAPGKVKLEVPETKGMKGSDLLVLIIDEKTGEMHLIAPSKFNSEEGIMTLDLPCVGPYCVLHKIPIVVRNVDPDLYPNKTLTKIIKDMPDNETMECTEFLARTLEIDEEDVEELEVDDDVYINPEDYTSAITLSDVAVHLGEDENGIDQFSYDLVTKFKANLFRANDKVNWERMLKYVGVNYDKTAILQDDKELTEIEPFVLEDSFLYHIDAVTREVSIIWEPTICWETYGELTKDKEDQLEEDDIQYFDVDDIDGQEIEEKKLQLDDEDKEELETSFLDELMPIAYAADVNLDEIDEDNNQALDEDDVCLVVNGDKYLGMGPFLVFMPKKEHKTSFPWWIIAILAAGGGGYGYYRKKNKKEEQVA